MPYGSIRRNPGAITNPHDDLCRACRALWHATLSLMDTHQQTRGPAQRVMLARRIARNVRTLERESEAFAPRSREAFSRLARRWAYLAGWQ